tara:strand:+ start:20 stop:259 length:240 start_codon:yes stop_codon:yes gene_type:complete
MERTYHICRRTIVRDINKTEVLYNIETMINTLEYDSMRSPGKTKVNAGLLVDLYNLKDIYTKELKNSKPTPVKKEVANG